MKYNDIISKVKNAMRLFWEYAVLEFFRGLVAFFCIIGPHLLVSAFVVLSAAVGWFVFVTVSVSWGVGILFMSFYSFIMWMRIGSK